MMRSLGLWLYSTLTRRYHDAYTSGKKKAFQIPAKVISVGNISTGGTGKSPFTRFIATECARFGISCAIISRGYGRKSKGLVVVSDGKNLIASVEEAGDEPYMNAEVLLREGYHVPVVVHENKVRAAQYAAEQCLAQCIIVDDGFQHRKLHRDCDIVLIDRFTLENPILLPVGRLREPLSSLARAQIVVAMNGVRCDELVPYAPQAQCASAWIVPGQPTSLTGCQYQQEPLLAIAGIAHPERFLGTAKSAGVIIRGCQWFSDHHRYTTNDVHHIINLAQQEGCSGILCTEKDLVKLRCFADLILAQHLELWYLPIYVQMSGLTMTKDFFMDQPKKI